MRLTLFADYRQFYLQDEHAAGDLSDAWTARAVDDRLAVAPGIFGVGTESVDDVGVSVDVLERAPADDRARWDHVTECSVDVPSGTVVVAGCTEYFPDARRVAVPAGTLRARVSHRLTGAERYRVQLWPGDRCEPTVVKRWSPPPPEPPPPRATKPPRTAKRAAEQARLGNTQLALDALLGFAAKGDAAAAASVAELLAFRGDWEGMVPHALALMAQPDAVYAGNVFRDMCLLVRRAATVLDDPALIARAAAVAPPKLADVVQACLIQGRPLEHAPPADAANRARFEQAVAGARTGKRFAGKPDALARHVFALAVAFDVYDEMIARWPSNSHLLSFDDAARTARLHVQRGRADHAWHILESMLPRWWPVAYAQVAPIALLYDPDLWPLMTPERCALVLATPRGPEAAGT